MKMRYGSRVAGLMVKVTTGRIPLISASSCNMDNHSAAMGQHHTRSAKHCGYWMLSSEHRVLMHWSRTPTTLKNVFPRVDRQ
ncbi:hypothetical protein AB1N83_013610 [Pleurotus pulmonarius]